MISIIRLVVLSRLREFDVTWVYVNSAIWSAAEPAMGVIAACLPPLRPLASLICHGSHRGPSLDCSSAKNTQTGTNSSSKTLWTPPRGDMEDADRGGAFTRSIEAGAGVWGHNTNINGGMRPKRDGLDDVSLEELNPGAGVIRVKNEVLITTEKWDYKDSLY